VAGKKVFAVLALMRVARLVHEAQAERPGVAVLPSSAWATLVIFPPRGMHGGEPGCPVRKGWIVRSPLLTSATQIV